MGVVTEDLVRQTTCVCVCVGGCVGGWVYVYLCVYVCVHVGERLWAS